MRIPTALATLAAFASPLPALAGAHDVKMSAAALIQNGEGEEIGGATLTQTPNGVMIEAYLSNLTPGAHGFHIHETGKCDAPDFKSAGGHFNPTDAEHGILVEGGPHAGDMPNIFFPEGDGEGRTGVKFVVFNDKISLIDGEEGYLLDDDGAAIMVHSGGDDYESQPAGDAGGRVACGVIEAEK